VSVIVCESCTARIDTDFDEPVCCGVNLLTGKTVEQEEAESRIDPLTDAQREWIADARRLLDFIEKNPSLIRHQVFCLFHSSWEQGDTAKAEMAKAARLLGQCEKSVTDDEFKIVRKFGDHFIQFYWRREYVCERVQVGVKTVEIPTYPKGVEVIYEKKEEPVYEWKCPDSILAGGKR
jgi:hypothetical protein